MTESRNKIAGLYDLEETIGEGHYAVVKLARHVFTGEKVAVKVIDKQRWNQSTQTQMLQEVKLMKLVQHPNVVRLYEVIDTATKLYLILELGDGGDMYDYIMKHEGGLGEEKARKYFKQIVTAIQYCHMLHVVHRDLKPENVVFFEKLGMVKLTDFGFSNKFDPGERLMTSCGSLAYSAPEILLGDAYDAPAVDIWSLGVILYMLVCGAAPFQEANDSETLTMIMDCNYSVPAHISKQCQSLISSMLCRDPIKRATLEQISTDPWLMADTSVPLWDMLPLVTREHLSEEDHAHILQKMVAGNIASREVIIDSLDRNDYNHVTATYFLLAERKLRSQRQDTARRARTQKRAVQAGQSKKNEGSPSATVESLLSPQENKKSNNSGISAPRLGYRPRVRQCSIVEEEEDEDDQEDVLQGGMPIKGLSRHSSTSSLADKSSPSLHLDLTLAFAAQRLEESANIPTPAPFPQSSQIGTGLSRQNSLRRSGENTSGSSPGRSTPGSPVSPTNSTTSPARFKLSSSSGRKLTNVRSTPQLSVPILNQIHEESEDGGGSPADISDKPRFTAVSSRPIDVPKSTPGVPFGAPSGAAVLRRLEQRRRLHKSRTASCSSSDASDDDSENRKKRGGRGGLPGLRDSNDSDNPDQGEGGSAGGGNFPNGSGGGSLGGGGGSSGGDGCSGESGGGSLGGARHYRMQRSSARVRQSSSLNRISELHEADFSCENQETDTPSGTATPSGAATPSGTEITPGQRRLEQRRQFTPQLSSESESDPTPIPVDRAGPGDLEKVEEEQTDTGTNGPTSLQGEDEEGRPPQANCDLLTRYLESLGTRSIRSRDDSLNSSDSEYTGGEDSGELREGGRRRSKVNLRQLEERLNMIQEECNYRNSDESDDERSATIDEPSDRNEDVEAIDNDDNDNQDNNNCFQDNKSYQDNTTSFQDHTTSFQDHTTSHQDHTTSHQDNQGYNGYKEKYYDRLDNFDSVFLRIEDLLNSDKKNCGRSRSEGWAYSDTDETPRIKDLILYPLDQIKVGLKEVEVNRDVSFTTSRGRPRSAPPRPGGKTLHRAHSCGSLMVRNRKVPGFWNILQHEVKPLQNIGSSGNELTLTLSSVAAPLSLIQLQAGASKCCNLC